MSVMALAERRPRLMAPEVVQTSAMDCGPAALKCILEGFRVPVSFGRLREACQTGVDGTSIDVIEEVANRLGIVAEQMLLPLDQLFGRTLRTLPALLVVRQPTGDTHFVVVWRRLGNWLQVMDPASGRRWLRIEQVLAEAHRHEVSVAAAQWRQWAATDEFRTPLAARLAGLGASRDDTGRLLDQALAEIDWFPIAALDASVRLVSALQRARGIGTGTEAVRLVQRLYERTRDNPHDIYTIIPADLWSVAPDPDSRAHGEHRLLLRGVVLVRLLGRTGDTATPQDAAPEGDTIAPELTAALREKPARPLATVWQMLRADGAIAPVALVVALAVAVVGLATETLLFRGLFDIGASLSLPGQRLTAALALIAFMALTFAFRFPIATEAMRLGRNLDLRLRMALLAKLPRLSDRYFGSRPVSDMAERSHSLHVTRSLPGMAIHLVQLVFELGLLLAGVAILDPQSAGMAAAIAAISCLLPMLVQGKASEAELRVRGHSAALSGVYLDSLLGAAPIRVHGAQTAIRRRYEGILLAWTRASRRMLGLSMLISGAQQAACYGLVCFLLWDHFIRAQGISASDLLLVYWALKVPTVGQTLVGMAMQYPAQRNVLLRLLEPLTTPEQGRDHRADAVRPPATAAASIEIRGGSVVASGHTILQDIDLDIAPGEHVAIVGSSGAGKSSLIGVLLGWHRLTEGALRIDGRTPDQADFESIRRHAAWVDPAIQLWNRSFLDNLTYAARDGGLGRVAAAIDTAHLRPVLRKLAEGQQTRLGEGGARLSGGEGQRVRLGRAMVQSQVRLALLDEPFRGLDRSQRTALLDRARRHWRDATLLCATHDIAGTRTFDRVLVVEGGRIVEDGAPERLAAADTRYRALLDAEDSAQLRSWSGRQWRRLRVAGGHVQNQH